MLVLNQNKNKIINTDNMDSIFIEDSIIFAKRKNNEKHILGCYKSDIRATEILVDFLKAKESFSMPVD